jgi:hypothetical protein
MPPLLAGNSSESEAETDAQRLNRNNRQGHAQVAPQRSQDHPAAAEVEERHPSDPSGRPQHEGNRQDHAHAQMKHKPINDDEIEAGTDSDTNEESDMKAVARHRGLHEAGIEAKSGALLREYNYKQKGAKAADNEQSGGHEHAHETER